MAIVCDIVLELGLRINVGYGLIYWNVCLVVELLGMEELNIGYSIMSWVILVGMERVVWEMKLVMLGLLF